MDVYISGVRMPKCCGDCWALEDYGDYPLCRITQEKRGYTFPVRNSRMDKCPLVPVSPHGRLIDASKCEGFFYEHMSDKMMEIAMIAIEEMPTVIPATEDE